MYDTDEEANQKISASVIMYKDAPVYVEAVRNRVATCYPVPFEVDPDTGRNKSIKIPLDDPALSFRNMRLGYVNDPHRGAIYVMRASARRSRQGISGENLRSISNIGGRRGDIDWNNLLTTPGLFNTLTNQYPSYPEALDVVDQSYAALKKAVNATPAIHAFSRQLAIERGNLNMYFIRHKGVQVCVTVGKPGQFHLTEEFEHLKESLEEHRVPLA